MGEAEEKRWQGWGDLGWGERAGLEGTSVSLPHMSFDVIQAKGHALVGAAPFGLLLALSSSAQLVLNDLGRRRGGEWCDWLEPRPYCDPTQSPAPAYLIGVVKELQYRQDAGPNEQPHLAPDVTCGGGEAEGGGSWEGQWCEDTTEQQSSLGQGQASGICRKIYSICTEGAQSNSGGGSYFLLYV